jgi:taurine dioxygenase
MECPPAGQALQAVNIPPSGGDTMFASTERAFESLSPAMQEYCIGLQAIHTEALIADRYDPDVLDSHRDTGIGTRETVHPVVRVHPETGRRSLYVNPMYTSRILDVSDDESRAMLDLLFAHIQRLEHSVRLRWEVGAIAVWDNRNTWHYAVDDYGTAPRRMQRVSLVGDRPRAA